MIKKSILLFSFLLLTACDSGDSDSGGMDAPTLPGTDVPASFAGVYNGTLNVTAQALNITRSDSFPITITVTDDAMVRFDGDSPDETFTVGIANDGSFSGTLPIDEDECTGTATVQGSVDGTTASGTVDGTGRCLVSGLDVEVTLEGDFQASR